MYPLIHHPGLAGRWPGFSRDRQILMIANELNRARNLLEGARDPAESGRCLERAFELIDLTVEEAAGTARFELLRFREALARTYADMVLAGEPVDRGILIGDLKRLFRVLMAFNPVSYAAMG